MSLKVTLHNANGEGPHPLKVYEEGQAAVVVHPHPPKGETLPPIPYTEYMVNGSDSSDMRVDGSTTAVEFAINAIPEKDTFIKTLSIILADQSMTLNKFGALTALSTGVGLAWKTADLGVTTINSGMKSSFEIIRQANGQPSADIINNVSGNAEGIIPVIDFGFIYGTPWGLRLRANTTDKLCLIVQDNLSVGLDAFNAIANGIRI